MGARNSIRLLPPANGARATLRLAAERLVWLCTVAGFVSACGRTPPEPALVYSLARVGSQALPATTDAALWPDRKVHQIQVLEGRLMLGADGSFKEEIHSRRAVDGVPAEDLGWARYSGVYKRSDSAVIARFDVQVALPEVSGQAPVRKRVPVTVSYHASDSGRVLRGLQGSDLVYEWVLLNRNPDPTR